MCYIVSMYIENIPNRNSPPAILVRECYRENGAIKKRTLANVTKWPQNIVDGLRLLLKGKKLVPVDSNFSIEQSLPHGHVEAVLGTIKKLKLDSIISSKTSRERNLVIAMIAERIIHPCSKLATTRLWHTTTLAEELSVADADVDELYNAMDWLLARQKRIEKKLAKKHLKDGSMALYDVSSSYYEGQTCPLVFFGHSRDKKKGKPIIVYGLMTNKEGVPVSIEVYPGNTGDPSTVSDQTDKLLNEFKLNRIILVGDRGMLTQTQIDELKQYPQIGWISALKSSAIRPLVEQEALQLSIFDKQNLAEITSPEYPDERLIACFNPLLASKRQHKRQALLEATEESFEKISKEISRRTKKILNKDEIGIKVGKVINKYKVGKHFKLTIEDNLFEWKRNKEKIEKESMLDGIYVVRTSEAKNDISAEDAVRNYKNLTNVERAFRCFKGIDLRVRPIRHRTEAHVRAHLFLCMLAYYVEWYMRKTWTSLLFEDEELEANKKTRDPVKQAQPSQSVKNKKKSKINDKGFIVHSFETLVAELSTLCKNKCRFKALKNGLPFYQKTEPTEIQKTALELLGIKCTQ